MSAPVLPQVQALPARNDCLQPSMGTGPDNELRLRVDGQAPVRPPLRRGIYLDPNRGLWSDPPPEVEWGAGENTALTQVVEAGATVTLASLAVQAVNEGGAPLVAEGLFAVQVLMTSSSNTGLVRLRGAVGAGSVPEDGPLIAVGSIDPGDVTFSAAVSFPLRVEGFARKDVTGRLWLHNATKKAVTVQQTARRLVFTGTTLRGDNDG
ncbi:hypothetical protein [Streptomyces sp. NPDC057302]|uniref:hypothetical protein n=1 Tax=Streptomyces sp. NPDC057302 TaxID=3346094 RepID=UPI00363F1980